MPITQVPMPVTRDATVLNESLENKGHFHNESLTDDLDTSDGYLINSTVLNGTRDTVRLASNQHLSYYTKLLS